MKLTKKRIVLDREKDSYILIDFGSLILGETQIYPENVSYRDKLFGREMLSLDIMEQLYGNKKKWLLKKEYEQKIAKEDMKKQKRNKKNA